MYHVIPRMHNANFVNKYGSPSISMEWFNRDFIFGRHIHHNKYLPPDDKLPPKVGVVKVTLSSRPSHAVPL